MSYQLAAPIAKNIQKTINVDFQATEATVKTFNFSADAKFINFTVEYSNAAGETKVESYEVNGNNFTALVAENITAIGGVRAAVWGYLLKNNLIGAGVDTWPA
jgi:hypothetical protein